MADEQMIPEEVYITTISSGVGNTLTQPATVSVPSTRRPSTPKNHVTQSTDISPSITN